MHDTLAPVGGANDSVAVTIARWHGASSTLSWISCGNPRPMRIDRAGRLEVLGSQSPPLGTPEAHAFTVERTRLAPGQRIILASDGILERPSARAPTSAPRASAEPRSTSPPPPRPGP
jgi:serine phosphatase RsbU (regulator of sigma subunit)